MPVLDWTNNPSLFSMSQSLTCDSELLGQVSIQKEVDFSASPSAAQGSGYKTGGQSWFPLPEPRTDNTRLTTHWADLPRQEMLLSLPQGEVQGWLFSEALGISSPLQRVTQLLREKHRLTQVFRTWWSSTLLRQSGISDFTTRSPLTGHGFFGGCCAWVFGDQG